jgi:hypothetical protein
MDAGGTDWIEAMRANDFARAWSIGDRHHRHLNEAAAAKHTGPRHLQTIWRGEPLHDKRVLVRCYHGLGDTIQFIRFAAPLRRIAREVTVWAQPELLQILRTAAGIDRLLPLHDGAPEVDFDVDIEIMGLGHALRAVPESLPKCPYLDSAGGRSHPATASGLRDGVAVGLVWEIGDWAPQRAIAPSLLAELQRMPEVKFFSLRPGAGAHAVLPIEDASSSTIADLAATMQRLDLIITIDTMAAHLAGALGLEVWTLLHADSDWRWGAGSRTPWYPTMRLFRQATAGEWSAPLAQAAAALRKRSSGAFVRSRT